MLWKYFLEFAVVIDKSEVLFFTSVSCHVKTWVMGLASYTML